MLSRNCHTIYWIMSRWVLDYNTRHINRCKMYLFRGLLGLVGNIVFEQSTNNGMRNVDQGFASQKLSTKSSCFRVSQKTECIAYGTSNTCQVNTNTLLGRYLIDSCLIVWRRGALPGIMIFSGLDIDLCMHVVNTIFLQHPISQGIYFFLSRFSRWGIISARIRL